ncbi:hypothetical protein NQ314_007617 [Rhamnusium bicolor]|uniref:Uncharacterized protein n=1 Tax=Rhamnusium bicolor TaxID=1586634 RepID=A0AAV8YND1_9CUCU|nr:hypothetical protein NQ314_007617 [Rhamnusium bicolor]
MSSMEEMNNFSIQQESLGKQLAQILTNAKKDSTSRKTEGYISSRLASIEDIWKNVNKNHAKIRTLDVPQHSYIQMNYYSQIQLKYEEAKKYLQDCPKATTLITNEASDEDANQPHVATADPNNDDMQIKRQRHRMQELDQIVQLIDKELLETKPRKRYELLLERISYQWSSIQALHEEIMIHETSFQSDYFGDDEYQKIGQQFENAVTNLSSKIDAASSIPDTVKPNLKLPAISIPFFDGNYEHWPTFNGTFLKLIHSNIFLSKVEKMQYLKSHVRGEPNRMIQHLQITDVNYDAAWELLKKRYENSGYTSNTRGVHN